MSCVILVVSSSFRIMKIPAVVHLLLSKVKEKGEISFRDFTRLVFSLLAVIKCLLFFICVAGLWFVIGSQSSLLLPLMSLSHFLT